MPGLIKVNKFKWTSFPKQDQPFKLDHQTGPPYWTIVSDLAKITIVHFIEMWIWNPLWSNGDLRLIVQLDFWGGTK